MSFGTSFLDIIQSLIIDYPEFHILKYVCKTTNENNHIKHITLKEITSDLKLFKWFCSYFQL